MRKVGGTIGLGSCLHAPQLPKSVHSCVPVSRLALVEQKQLMTEAGVHGVVWVPANGKSSAKLSRTIIMYSSAHARRKRSKISKISCQWSESRRGFEDFLPMDHCMVESATPAEK